MKKITSYLFHLDDNPIKISRPIKELAYRVHRTQEKLTGIFGREPTISEVAKELSTSPQEIVAALEAVQPQVSLHAQAFHQNNLTQCQSHKKYRSLVIAKLQSNHQNGPPLSVPRWEISKNQPQWKSELYKNT